MAKLPDLYVNAVTTFDGKALTKGQKQIAGFEKNVKNLAKAFGLTFSAAALAQYGKNAVKAFAASELEVAQLTTSVRNLGLAFATPEINQYIDKLEAATGVNRDQLQPAMIKLLQVTGSVAKSQEILNLAMDVAAGTGTDLAKTSEILSQAYVGNFKGLRSLNLGLTQAELASSNFEDVQKRLQVLFAGQAKVAADSYVGSINKLAIASENASEKIGKSLIDALTALSGGRTIDDTISKIDTLSTAIAGLIDATVGLKAGEILQQYYGLNSGKIPGGFGNRSLSAGNQDTQKADAKARAKAEADAAKRQRELLALQKKSALAEKNKISLSKAAAVFDTQRISIAAALRATYDKETILRLEALQAIEEDNGDLALKKIGELAALQKNADMAKLAGITQISEATLSALNAQLLAELKVINESKMAEADKEAARQIAFGKYNAALTAAGELAAKESYSERVQIQLTEIARLASLSKTSNAATTLTKLRESEELSMIERVAAAQKKADDARLKALQEYAALLAKIGSGGPSSGGPVLKTEPKNDPFFKQTPDGITVKTLPRTTEEINKAVEDLGGAISVIGENGKEFIKLIEGTAEVFQTVEDSGAFNALVKAFEGGAINSFNAGTFRASEGATYGTLSRGGAFDRDTNVTINVNTGIGDPEAIARAIEDTLNQSSYRGTSVNRGSGDYLVA